MARKVIYAKIRQSKAGIATFEARAKIFRFAMQRGFETAIASEIIKEYVRDLEDEEAEEYTEEEA